MQVKRSEQAILPSTYYTGCVHSILGKNLNGARSYRFVNFFRHTVPLGIFGFFAENQIQDFSDFLISTGTR